MPRTSSSVRGVTTGSPRGSTLGSPQSGGVGWARAISDDVHERLAWGAAALVWAVGLAAVTLTPNGGPVARILSFCLLCGERGTADAVLNVVLFVPLGLLIGRRRGALVALALGVMVAVGVETAQLLLRGRYSNVGDLLWNGAGAWLGGLLAPAVRKGLDGPVSLPIRGLTVGLPVIWILAAGILLRPAPVSSGFSFDDGVSLLPDPISGEDVRDLAPVHPADAATHLLENATMDRSPDGTWRLRATTVRRQSRRRVTPIVVVYDAADRPIRVLGADRGDLVLWERTWAEAVGLDHASHRLGSGLLEHPVGRVLTITASRTEERGLCLAVEGRRACGLGTAPARTWTLLRSREHGSTRLKTVVDIAWMATLTLSIGLLGGTARATVASATLFALIVLGLPHVTPLVSAGWAELVGIGLGVGVGASVRPVARMVL